MIYQLHHEDVFTGKIEFVAQNEIEDTVDQLIFDAWFHEWFAGVRSRHPLPENCRWFVCREGAPQFMVAPKGRITHRKPFSGHRKTT